MSKASELTDLVIKTIVTKLEAMDGGHGLLSKSSITSTDRLIVAHGSVKPQYHRNVVVTEHTEKDLKAAKKILDEIGRATVLLS